MALSRGLVLAEKPSLMRALETAYKSVQSQIGCEMDFAAFHGHIMRLWYPEEYNPQWATWDDVSFLPMMPNALRYRPDDKKCVAEITAKLKSGRYDYVVNACDAGREGELIFWSFYESTGIKLPVKRLWVSSTSQEALGKALGHLLDEKDFRGLKEASIRRAEFDWLVGMNFTRAASAAYHRFVPVGRVQSPTLYMIVQREKEIHDFVPTDFFEVKARFALTSGEQIECVELLPPKYSGDTRYSSKPVAGVSAREVMSIGQGKVVGIKEVQKEVPAPTLLSLAELQKAANKALRYTPDKTLDIAQKLYEKGLLSYPRTESRFLPADMVPELEAHLRPLTAIPELQPYAAAIGKKEIDEMAKKKYINDAGVTDHYALIPTDQIPQLDTLTEDEIAIYTIVCKAFLAIFLPPYRAGHANVLIQSGKHIFRAQGRTEIDKGYMVLYPEKKARDTPLPHCQKGDILLLQKVGVATGTTKPPPRYTPGTILTAMQNAGQDLEDASMRSVLREAAGLGTSATRADILARLVERKFVEIKGNTYYALPEGIRIIDSVGNRLFCSPALTGEWEQKLKAVEERQYRGDFRADMAEYIKSETAYLLSQTDPEWGKVVGTCPLCGGKILAYDKNYCCEHRRGKTCTMWLPRTLAGQYELNSADVTALLNGGILGPLRFQRPDGSSWTRSFHLSNGELVPYNQGSPSLGSCPLCGGRLIETGKGFVCENRQDLVKPCSLWIPRYVGGVPVTSDDIVNLLARRPTEEHVIKTKKGTDWRVRYILTDEGKFEVEDREPLMLLGQCPKCRSKVYGTTVRIFCERTNTKRCDWAMMRRIKGTRLKDTDIKKMLAGQKTDRLDFLWGNGQHGKARLFLNAQGDLGWDFGD